jgi:RHS repeat-associated protein
MPIAAEINGRMYAIPTDHLNTPRRLTNQQGQVAWQWLISGFGEVRPTTGDRGYGQTVSGPSSAQAVKFDLRYPGQVSDEETGLSYNLHRYYDAATGRYIQADPIGLEGGWNRFAYVSNNPLNLIDPLGLSAADIDFMLKSLEREFDEFRPRGKWRFGLPSNFDDIAATEPISGDMIFRPEWSEPGCLSSEEFYTRIRKVFHEGMHSTDSILRRILGGDRNHNMIWNRGRWEFGDLHPSKRKKEGDIWGDPRGKPVDADKIYGNYLNHVPDCTCRR